MTLINTRAGGHSGRRPGAAYLATLPRHRASHDAAGQVLYLPLTGTTAVAYQREPGGWQCVILTDPNGTHPPGGRCRITDLETETALPIPLGDPLDGLTTDEFVQVWLTRVWGHAHHGYPNSERINGTHLYAMARALATDLRSPGDRSVVWDRSAQHRIALIARVLPPAQHRLITTLTEHRLLTRTLGDPAGPPVLSLRLPDEDPPEPAAQAAIRDAD